MSSYHIAGLPASTTVNGLTMGLPTSVSYNQAMLGSSISGIYTGTTTSVQDAVYTDSRLSQGYTLSQAVQSQHGQDHYSGMQTLGSVSALLGNVSGEMSLALTSQQQALIARGLSVEQGRASASSPAPAPSQHVLGPDQQGIAGLLSSQVSVPHQQPTMGVIHSLSGAVISHTSSLASLPASSLGTRACVSMNVHQNQSTMSMAHLTGSNVTVSVLPQNVTVVHPSQGTLLSHPQEGPSLTGLLSVQQMQGHCGWAELPHQNTLGYHNVNGFPTTVLQQVFTNAGNTVLQSTSQVKYATALPLDITTALPLDMALTLAGGGNSSGPPTPTLTKQEMHASMGNPVPSPRVVALSQQLSRSHAGSPGYGHSPSPPAHAAHSPGGLNVHLAAHSPQSLNQSLAAAYQGSSNGS